MYIVSAVLFFLPFNYSKSIKHCPVFNCGFYILQVYLILLRHWYNICFLLFLPFQGKSSFLWDCFPKNSWRYSQSLVWNDISTIFPWCLQDCKSLEGNCDNPGTFYVCVMNLINKIISYYAAMKEA